MRVVGAAWLTLAVFSAECARAGEPESPVYDGKTVAQWTSLLTSEDVSERRRVVLALQELGGKAKPAVAPKLSQINFFDKLLVLCQA